MPPMTDQSALLAATVVVGVAMFLSGLLLIGFRRGRLRRYNIYIVFSIAALGFVYFGKEVTGHPLDWAVLAAWVNLAVGSAIGLVGMLDIAKKDPPVWGGGARHQRTR